MSETTDLAPITDQLNARELLFCREFLFDLNASAAVVRAGYSENGAAVQGHRLMEKEAVKEYIQQLMNERAERQKIDGDYVLSTIRETIERARQAVPVLNKKGKQVFIETPNGELAAAFMFDAKNVLKGAELLGKHLKLFTDVTETRHTFTQMPTVEIANADNPNGPRLRLSFDIGQDPEKPPNAT